MDIIRDSSGWGGRRPTASGVLQGGFSNTTIDVYVDGVNGSDLNGGLSSSDALATIPAIYQKFPWQLMEDTKILVHLLNPNATQLTYTAKTLRLIGGNDALACTFAFRGPEMVRAVPATGPSTAALDAASFVVRVDQTGASSGSGNRTKFNFTTAAPGWTVNDLAGCFLRIKRGSQLVLNEIPICENTSNSITVDVLGIVGVVLSSDTVEICHPAVKIAGPAQDVGGTDCHLLNIVGQGESSLHGPGSNYSTFERIAFATVTAQGQGCITFDRCLFDHDNDFLSRFADFCPGFVNTASRSGLGLHGTQSGAAYIRDADTIDTGVHVTDLQIAPRPGEACYGLAIGSQGVETFPQGPTTYVAIAPLSVYRANNGYPGIYVSGPGSFFQMTDSVALNGAGNAEVGLHCTWGAIARINGGALSTITGTGGSLKVATGSAVAYGTGANQFEQAAGWNGNLIRLALTSTTAVGDTARITTSNVF